MFNDEARPNAAPRPYVPEAAHDDAELPAVPASAQV